MSSRRTSRTGRILARTSELPAHQALAEYQLWTDTAADLTPAAAGGYHDNGGED